MKRNIFFTAGLLLSLAIPALSQTDAKFIGAWNGVLNVGAELHIIFHIQKGSNVQLVSTADSPDQSAFGLKCDTTFVTGDKITIELRNLQATFSGKLINDSTLDGVFTQGADLPLILTRKTENGKLLPAENSIPAKNYKSTEVNVKVKDLTLSGTLFQPLKIAHPPVVLIISGSGPTDRDGNSILLPGKNNSLLQIADSLAQYGIASLRYDKRGVGKSKPDVIMVEKDLTIDTIANDAMAMYNWLKSQGFDRIYIAGHSEGSLIGLMISVKTSPKGFISLSGAGRKAGDILKEQVVKQLSQALNTEFDNSIDSLEKGLTVQKVSPGLMNLLRPSIQPYMKSWLAVDPQKLISQLKCPALIIQGTKDLQITQTDAEDLHKANPASTLVLVKDMNHVLKEVNSENQQDNVNAYSDPTLLIKKEVVAAIVNFIGSSRQ